MPRATYRARIKPGTQHIFMSKSHAFREYEDGYCIQEIILCGKPARSNVWPFSYARLERNPRKVECKNCKKKLKK